MNGSTKASPLGALNKATPNNGQAMGATKADCPPQWTLNVKVEIAPGYKYDTSLTLVLVALDGIQGTTDMDLDHCEFEGAGSQPTVQFKGNRVVNFRVTGLPSDETWRTVRDEKVSLAPGDNKNVTLQLRSRPWIRIKVVDDDSKQPVDGVQVDMDLPGKNKVNQTTAGGQPCYWNCLDPGKGKLEKMSDANQVWEMVRLESA